MVDIGQMAARVTLPQEHRELVCQFLLVFSRFEAALKTAGYVRQNADRLTVEWRRFVREAGAVDIPIVELDLLIRNPPARQTVVNQELVFVAEQAPARITTKWLLEMVYRVRNNLFHGGKWPANPERDGPLLGSCLSALAFFIDLAPAVRAAYFAE